MKFESILDREENPRKEELSPAFLTDLNLYRIIERINLYWGENVSSMYGCLPADAAGEDYRREVFADVGRNGLYETLCAFREKMQERREAFVEKEKISEKLQKGIWHVREADGYCRAFWELNRALKGLPLTSEGMRAFRDCLREYTEGEEFGRMRKEAAGILEELGSFQLTIVYENDRLVVTENKAESGYDDFLRACFPGQDRRMKSPFASSRELTELERELLKSLRKRNPEFFERVEDFYERYREYAPEVLIRFTSEIGYYLSFYCFEQKMKEKGYEFAAPVLCEEKTEAAGLYDLALACAEGVRREDIVSNGLEYRPGESFFVLTGPNQGGKTTFARSLGQLIYFTKMGLDVPAVSARVQRFSDLMTHFSVEESVETGRGRLKDELSRLAPMMDTAHGAQTGAFVILNELFTTAANYDACLMGKRVLEHFIGLGCRGIYVTHLRELADAHPRVVSLRAMLDEQGRQTFRIARSRAGESAGAVALAERHGLTYERLRERCRDRMRERNG
ncbi:MAG: hypothetical protein NC541_01265 [bacterium]|nr:hypothetical protein [bacterium]